MPIFAMCGCALCAGGPPAAPSAAAQALSGQKSTVIQTAISGDYRIDVLLDNAGSRWNSASAPGTPVEVTYSFAVSAPSYGSASDVKNWSAFTEEQKTTQREIFGRISEVANITFREVADSADSYGVIRFHNNDQGATSGGYAYYPDVAGPLAGDVFINNVGGQNLSNIVRGSYAYSLMIHEVFHAIGIKHPGNYNAGEPPQQVPGNFLIETEDNYGNTIMSYIALGDQGLQRDFAGPYDLLALQYLYGSKAVRTGNTAFNLADSDGRKLSLIVDSGGRDTIDVSASTVGATINLNQGASSSFGKTADGAAAVGNLQIAFGSIIENATGTASNDRFIGNGSNNTFRVNGGADTIDGGAGIDTVIVTANRAGASRSGDLLTYGANSAAITNVERVWFNDALVAYDTGAAGNAGLMYRLYQAAFNRTPDLGGVSYWTNVFDNGGSIGGIAGGFTNSTEFKGIYGAAPTNNQIIDRFYQNVLGRAGEAAGITYWVGELNGGRSVETVLTLFANSDENIARTAPALSNGMLLDAGYFVLV